jgi:glycosyl transferase family 2
MVPLTSVQKSHALLGDDLRRLRGDPGTPPRASIIVPVNAQKDILRILTLLSDLTSYRGSHSIEIILVVNNYPANNPPQEIDEYGQLGVRVLGIPKVEHVGGVAIAARIPGIEVAQSERILLFDADCRIQDPTALLDWYIQQLEEGVDLAYTRVDYIDLPAGLAIRTRMLIHHAIRWYKRVLLGIPTSRGSDYAIRRQLIIDLFAQQRVPYDIHVGPVVKAMGGKIAYSAAKQHAVFTSGRFFSNSWRELFSYLIWRTGYYLRVKPTKPASPPVEQ